MNILPPIKLGVNKPCRSVRSAEWKRSTYTPAQNASQNSAKSVATLRTSCATTARVGCRMMLTRAGTRKTGINPGKTTSRIERAKNTILKSDTFVKTDFRERRFSP